MTTQSLALLVLSTALVFAQGCKACSAGRDGDGDSGRDVVDADGDGYGAGADCDDRSSAIHPGAVEVCDGLDNDCDGDTDDDALDARAWYADQDGDGYGDAEGEALVACDAPTETVADATDCDDADAATNPGADELCADELDNDCDGDTDDADADAVARDYYLDEDGDGYGLDEETVQGCAVPEGYADEGGDCDDADADVNPGAFDPADGDDNDCDGVADDDPVNFDGTVTLEVGSDVEDLAARDCILVLSVHGERVRLRDARLPEAVWVYATTWTYEADQSYDPEGDCGADVLQDVGDLMAYVAWAPDHEYGPLLSSEDLANWERLLLLGDDSEMNELGWDETTGLLSWTSGTYEEPEPDYHGRTTNWIEGEIRAVPAAQN